MSIHQIMMKRRLAVLTAVDNRFIFIVQSDNAGTSGTDQFTIPTTGAGYLYDIETSDGYTATGVTGAHTITFPTGAGTHTVFITGDFPRIYFNNGGDKLKITGIIQWGDVGFSNNQSNAFYGCLNLTSIPNGGHWFNTISVSTNMFRASGLTSLPSDFLISNLTSGVNMFLGCPITSLPSDMVLENLIDGTNMFFATSIISLPNGITLSALTNGLNMFRQTPLSGLGTSLTLNSLLNGTDMFRESAVIDLPAGVSLLSLTNGTRMFFAETVNTTRYSQLLIDMENLNPNNTVTFHGGFSKYNTAGQTARNALIARGWTITDGGLE